ncbi:MAG: DNA topoisomerase IV subunit B [Rickettsiaceae bacterium]|nr:DNA topoisomerase IV subunit B [Rickettsiaceae bacterium]MDP5020756.1 DNA topoisomerase IV subunit B [Rickettsiaceae bacterium]MDP5083479.1 DNA topoisomerase IV subunit B [Rickettsiaceae bacterium]
MSDLFGFSAVEKGAKDNSYTANDIEVLEGLEPVRMRPGMYIGGTDDNALHHLVSEVLDNSMDEAVAGFASKITIEVLSDGSVTIGDNGRGIPIDNHPKFPKKSALEVIFTTLHSGGKFSDKVYQTSGGLHGVGISVVNALSESLVVEVYRDGSSYIQKYSRGVPLTKLEKAPALKKLKGTRITFKPDAEIFGASAKFKPKRIYDLAKSKAYLYKGVEIHWSCASEVISSDEVLENDIIHFPGGLRDYLDSHLDNSKIIGGEIFSGNAEIQSNNIKIEWAIAWHETKEFVKSYCNTIPTPMGGTHEQGIRAALSRGVKIYGEMTGHKKIVQVMPDDILESACMMLSVFIKDPVFQGQTKEKLVSNGITKQIENLIKDHFDHWLSGNKKSSDQLIQHFINNAEYRLSRKNERLVSRKTAVQKLRLPGKLADCSSTSAEGTELFLVEGDSAGGSAKQARDRQTQAILPLRGKILNVANATAQKISANQEIQDLEVALNCGSLNHYKEDALRYEKIIIMTDADVDGAHIAALLMTFFYIRMRKLIENGHLYLAKPPLYRLIQGTKTYYAADEEQKEKLLKELSKDRKTVEVGRFKGLGEMTPKQLKETTMEKKSRLLYKVGIADFKDVDTIVDNLMGKKPEKRFQFIQEQALARGDQEIELYV